jgi:hypothetical protein
MTEHSPEPGTSKRFLPLLEVLRKLEYLLGSHCLGRYDLTYSNFFVSDAEQENKPLTLLTSIESSIFLFLVQLETDWKRHSVMLSPVQQPAAPLFLF